MIRDLPERERGSRERIRGTAFARMAWPAASLGEFPFAVPNLSSASGMPRC
jgi:hypothetical protein